MGRQPPPHSRHTTAPHFLDLLESTMKLADAVQSVELSRLKESVLLALGFIGYTGSGEVLARYVLNDRIQQMASRVRTDEAMLSYKNQPLYAARHGVTLRSLDVKKRQLKALESLFDTLQTKTK